SIPSLRIPCFMRGAVAPALKSRFSTFHAILYHKERAKSTIKIAVRRKTNFWRRLFTKAHFCGIITLSDEAQIRSAS
ncbi:MAG: hypothetical protein LUJ25_00580, partial [Firmicutes bacterium]|nr:hypothetical protein [Bacillota bacterium]